ncbi:MAG: CoA-binding protein [Candidatus Aenigmarchaeota archaeon]|nr:CoA-binding protein [Candidatus Aenigmarchaeota archaeon]
MHPLDPFFSPRSVAVVGASRNPSKVGHVIYRNFLEGGFRGQVYPVNPNAPDLFGHPCFPSLAAIPGPVDLAVITVPAELVPAALEDCGRKKVPAVILISAGFAEIGKKQEEEQLKAIGKKYRLRILGPNCLGVFDPATGVDTLFLPRFKLGRPEKGSIAYISQSGATGSVVLDWMAMKGYKVSKFVSYGNAMDIDEADLLTYLAQDRDTKVICAYFEGVREGRRFYEVARSLAGKKPVIVLKGGQTPAGTTAALSHTGSLAGEARIFDAALRQAGVIKAADLEQIFDFARTFASSPPARGDRVQVITNGGGFGVLTADAIYQAGLRMASLADQTKEELTKALPSHVIIKNPIDLTGDADTHRYALALDAVLRDPGVDLLAVVTLFQVPTLTPDVVEVLVEAKGQKPMVVIAAGGKYTEVLKKPLEDVGIPTFSYPERAVAALKALVEYSGSRAARA